MRNIKSHIGVCVFVAACVCGGLSREAYGIRNYTNHPDLARAMECDPEENGGDMKKADRAKAEYHYLRYLADVNDSFQRAHVYCQLGALYSVTFNKEKGEEPNDAKAMMYCRKILESEPNRIGRPTIIARCALATMGKSDWMDRVKGRVAFYQWLNSLDEKTIQEKWLPITKEVPASSGVHASGQPGPGRAKFNVGNPNVPTPSEVKAMLGHLESHKEVAIGNAVDDALAMKAPEEGLNYILEQLPKDAKERGMVQEAMRDLSSRVANEGLRAVLNTFTPKPPAPDDQAGPALAVKGDSGEDPNQVAREITTVRRRFIPHMNHARQEGLDPVLELKTGERIPVGDFNEPNNARRFVSLAALKRGDIAWADTLLAVRRAQVVYPKRAATPPTQAAPTSPVSVHKLPVPPRLPYTAVVRNAEGAHYLLKILEIKPTGIEVMYRRLSPAELPDYLEPPLGQR